MANVKVELDYPINDGMSLTFKAPCDCTAVTGLIVYYPNITNDSSVITSKTFIFKDAHGNTLTGIGNLFSADSYVKVVLDTVNNFAFIQNADTNGYLENSFDAIVSDVASIANSKANKTTTINGKALSSNITLQASDFTRYADGTVTVYSDAPVTLTSAKVQENFFANVCFFRAFVKTTAKLTAGEAINILSVSTECTPATHYALSGYCMGGSFQVMCNSSGNIRVMPDKEIASGQTLYIAGFWFI